VPDHFSLVDEKKCAVGDVPRRQVNARSITREAAHVAVEIFDDFAVAFVTSRRILFGHRQ